MRTAIGPGMSFPLGATMCPHGVNFSIFSKSSTGVDLLLFNAVNDAPTLTLPPSQVTGKSAPLTLSSGLGNVIQVADVDANGGVEQITLSILTRCSWIPTARPWPCLGTTAVRPRASQETLLPPP